MEKNEEGILPSGKLSNGEATKTLSNHFQVGKDVIKTLKNRGGLTFQGIEEILLKSQEFRDHLEEKLKVGWRDCHDSKILLILLLGGIACAFVSWKNFTIFNAFLSFLTLERTREIIKNVMKDKGGAPSPDKVMEAAINEFNMMLHSKADNVADWEELSQFAT